VYELEKGSIYRQGKEETNTYIADTVWPIRGSLGGKKVIEASQKWILTAVFTLEGEKRYSLWSHCRREGQNENVTFNSMNTDLRAFFEAKEGPPSSCALFLSLIVAGVKVRPVRAAGMTTSVKREKERAGVMIT
jgi:hypothetical protein